MKHRPWKPSLDAIEEWRSFLLSLAAMAICAVLLWGIL